jgi:transcription elongation GreA/GreB family factor
MEKRRLVCGNPYSFQGDERDIILLSMVAAPNERIGPLTMGADERRFNVAASRARDQMWLFHSVIRDDLSASCLRRSLLEFFEETKVEPIQGINLEDLEKSAHHTNRSIVKPPEPFDSWFEVDVALEIARKGYYIIPQLEVAGKFIDLVIEGGQARLAVECDGDESHGVEQYENDMQRQRLLERCGWVFYRIRASAFYADRESALNSLWEMLEERGIRPQSGESVESEEYSSGTNEEPPSQETPKQDEKEQSEQPADEMTINSVQVEVGDTVVYAEEETPDLERQALITHGNSNPDWGEININTPIAQALLGASIGQIVTAKLPVGGVHLRIKEIRKATS